jgi:hypothetical protein
MMDARVKTEISEWIVRAALVGTSEIEIVGGVCQRVSSAGVSLVRSSVATNLLDPTLDARIVFWIRGQGQSRKRSRARTTRSQTKTGRAARSSS